MAQSGQEKVAPLSQATGARGFLNPGVEGSLPNNTATAVYVQLQIAPHFFCVFRGKVRSLPVHHPEYAGVGDVGWGQWGTQYKRCHFAVFYSPTQRGSPKVSSIPPSFPEQPRKGISDAQKHPSPG